MLTAPQIASAQRILAEIPDIHFVVSKFYDRLFADYPDLRPMFHSNNSGQVDKLAATLSFAFSKLDDLDSLVPILQQMGARHKKYGAIPEYYDAVAASLIATIAQELGDTFDQFAQDTFRVILGTVAQAMLSGTNATA